MKINSLFYRAITITVFIFFLPLYVGQAHQTGASWEKIVNGYKVDIGYDPTTFFAGQSQRFDFNAFAPVTNDPVNFSDVWVRISLGEQTVFASGIHKSDFGPPGMIFVFPKAGNYTLNVRFENKDQNFVESSQDISVGPSQDNPPAPVKTSLPLLPVAISGVLGLLLGSIGVWSIKKNKARSRDL